MRKRWWRICDRWLPRTSREGNSLRNRRTTWALASYAVIVFAFRFGLEWSVIGQGLGTRLPFAFSSFALLLAPLWFFGFGAGEWLHDRLSLPVLRIATGALLGTPYLVFAIPTSNFHWTPAIIMIALPVVLAALLESAGASKLS